ncbi:Acylphosphatase, partial [Frankliniella fusca]
SDSLLPSDSYAQPPPDYPLYSWTLPYGPDVYAPAPTPAARLGLGQPLGVAPASSPAPAPAVSPAIGHPQGRYRHLGPSRLSTAQYGPVRHPPPAAATAAALGAGEPVHTQYQPRPAEHPEQQVRPLPPCSLDEFLDDDVVEIEVRSSRPGEAGDSERVVFDSIEDALLTIEAQDQGLVHKQCAQACDVQQVSAPLPLPLPMPPPPARVEATRARDWERGADRGLGLGLGDGTQEDVVKAAKSLFSKRTRTLYHWLYPDTSKTKLKATVSAAWDTLAESEKQFYLSQ